MPERQLEPVCPSAVRETVRKGACVCIERGRHCDWLECVCVCENQIQTWVCA